MLSLLYRRLPSGFIHYQKNNFMSRQKNSKPRSLQAMVSLLFLFVIVGIASCESKKEEAKSGASASTENKAAESSTAVPKPFATTVTLPAFTWSKDDIAKLFGPGKKNPKTMLIKIGHDDYNNHIATMQLYVYPAKDHKHYAAREDGIQLTKDASTAEINNILMIGNNDFDFDKFFTADPGHQLKEFHHALFTPTTYDDPNGKTHLVFNVTLVRGEKKDATVDENLGNSNPSPPADPSHN